LYSGLYQGGEEKATQAYNSFVRRGADDEANEGIRLKTKRSSHWQPFEPDPVNTGVGKRAERFFRCPAAFAAFLLSDRHTGKKEAYVQIIVNGEPTVIQAMTVLDFLLSLSIDPKRVAVELNLDILPKANYKATLLNEGDRLEIVHFVGGG
jgi:sulfur carrier protein